MCQLRLGREAWPTGTPLRVRMGLHTGEVRVRGGDHVDYTPINRCARVRAAGHGGQVLLTNATRDLVAGRLGSGFGLKELGEFRLRDLAAPELIFQLTHPELLVEFPPIHTVAERTGNLPLQVSSFIGRGRELEHTAAALGEARLVTLTGAGGVGKTRLALQVAGQLSPAFEDGAWLCELAPVRDPTGVNDAVAAVFSVTAPAGQSTRDALVEFLRAKQLLLVLEPRGQQLMTPIWVCPTSMSTPAAADPAPCSSGTKLVTLAFGSRPLTRMVGIVDIASTGL